MTTWRSAGVSGEIDGLGRTNTDRAVNRNPVQALGQIV